MSTDSRFIDIAINLTDPVYRGLYHGKKKHEDDMTEMLQRCKVAGVKSMIITGGSLSESKEALDLAKELDYDRTHFADPETQKKYFRVQLSLAKKHHLPLFLHSRAAHKDFVQILRDEGFGVDGGRTVGARGGVVHSFTGLPEEVSELTSMGFHVGINGCSLKTKENLDAAKSVPLNLLMLETDGPWCTMNPTHASKAHLDTMPSVLRNAFFPPSVKAERFVKGKVVKGRNEPIAIGGVAWVMHRLLQVPYKTLVDTTWDNTVRTFGLSELVDETPTIPGAD
ncbi:TatD DNase domain containing 1 [Coprinopsis cinerea okayama7|uniref:TatD DNase domain containing 1 n=1 Tax=Coprinopsis cinerea (strain Okayama-7 / 130 / ATCC MYA-4618 / FGSC 9003) TaxID=240176 RepID=D6RK11_COPC7|nr:TatD DNase domain containing 1 [Coprinopsis cinerea okayama7\|eukprot:XP_002912162.1 TatD DNase domain containing 1 [Coprinopsis cinerea okayama7\